MSMYSSTVIKRMLIMAIHETEQGIYEHSLHLALKVAVNLELL